MYVGVPVVTSLRASHQGTDYCLSASTAYEKDNRNVDSVLVNMIGDCFQRASLLVIPEGSGFILRTVENRGLATGGTDNWCDSYWALGRN